MKNYIFTLLLFVCTWNLSAQCTDNGNYWNNSWVSCEKSSNPNPIRGNTHWILYEFHTPHAITGSHFWNANRIDESGQGIKEAAIDFSEDGITWQELGTYDFPKADETSNYEGFEGPDFGGLFIQKILLTVLSTHDDDNCAALAEVQFGIDTTVCYGVIDVCGVCNGPGEPTWYLDADEDGLGDANNSVSDCEQPTGYVANASDSCDNGALGWDDIQPLFADNGCNSCHNGNAAGGLDLRSYETTILGGNICGTNLFTGSNFVASIITSSYDGCGSSFGIPSMNNRASGDFDATELALLQKWIDGDAPSDCTAFNFGNLDEDEDGFTADEDCDDTNPAINPEAEEIPNNNIDEDCDGSDLVTSTYEIDHGNVTIFPNPVSRQLSVLVEGIASYEVRLFDTTGKLLLQKTNVRFIDVSKFPSGSYLLELQDLETKQTITERIIIAK